MTPEERKDEELARKLRAKWEVDNALKTIWHTPEELKDLEHKIAEALRQVRNEAIEAAAKVASEYHHGKLGNESVLKMSSEMAQAIRTQKRNA